MKSLDDLFDWLLVIAFSLPILTAGLVVVGVVIAVIVTAFRCSI